MFIDTIRNTIVDNNLIAPDDHVLVAFSGGSDSSALLHSLLELQSELQIKLSAAHVNHLLRGSESDQDQLWCAQFCRELDIPFHSKKIDVQEYAENHKMNLEEAARELRYNYLHEVCKQIDADKIAVAHNQNDQAETVIMRLVRGAGLSGLTGMGYRVGDIIRPLLAVERAHITDYLREKNIIPRHDSSNDDERFARVIIRNHIDPALRRINPSYASTIQATSEIIGDEDSFLNDLATQIMNQVSENFSSGMQILRDHFVELDVALQRRILRRVILKITGSLRTFTIDRIEAIRKAVAGDGPAVQFGGYIAQPNADGLVICRQIKNHSESFIYQARIGQTVEIKEVDKRFALRIIESACSLDFVRLSGPTRAFLAAEDIVDTITIRNWEPGDRYKPYNAPGSQKLQDIFINAGMSISEKAATPVFVSQGQIIWVYGFRIADQFRINNNTKKILAIEEV